jgi:mycofactocin system glycosyltransferase
VRFEQNATFVDRDLVTGGSPWRLLRFHGSARATIERWRSGGVVQRGEERLARTLTQQGLLLPDFNQDFNPDEIDVIVPIYNHVEALSSLLEQLRDFHVTVVDDNSVDHEAVRQCALRYGANVERCSQNRGPANARNVGARATSRELVWFIDADVAIDDARHVARRLQCAFCDPLVGAVAPRVRGVDGPTARERFEHHFSPLDRGTRTSLVVPNGGVSYVPSACLMVRRQAIGEGFDTSLRVGEDVNFVWSLSDRGWLVRYDATVEVQHVARTSWPAWWRQRQRYGASSGPLSTRHGARLAPLRSDPWTLAAWGSLLVGQPLVFVRILAVVRSYAARTYFSNAQNPSAAANEIVLRNMLRAGGPLARSLVRTFGVVVLASALHPRLRRRALTLFALGTLWRWRHSRLHLADVPLAIADDLAYGVGVAQGAWNSKSLRPLTPVITKSAMRLRDVLGRSSSSH